MVPRCLRYVRQDRAAVQKLMVGNDIARHSCPTADRVGDVGVAHDRRVEEAANETAVSSRELRVKVGDGLDLGLLSVDRITSSAKYAVHGV
jgi:hypothetical protein